MNVRVCHEHCEVRCAPIRLRNAWLLFLDTRLAFATIEFPEEGLTRRGQWRSYRGLRLGVQSMALQAMVSEDPRTLAPVLGSAGDVFL